MKQLLLKQFHWLIDDDGHNPVFLTFDLILLHDTASQIWLQFKQRCSGCNRAAEVPTTEVQQTDALQHCRSWK